MHITIENKLNIQEVQLGKRIINHIFRVSTITASILLSFPLSLYMFYTYQQTASAISLFFALFGLVFLTGLTWLLVYSLRIRPLLYRSLTGKLEETEHYSFTDTGISCSLLPSVIYSTDQLLGQYWYNDYYCCYLSSKQNKQFLMIKITPGNVNDINRIVQFYHARRKRLTKLKLKH